MNAVSVRNLNVRFDNQVILERLSFNIPQKSITAIIGPNGSGKTTLLKAMLGLIPYQGEVLILGKEISQSFEKIAYVPQRFSFDKSFPITVDEFLNLEISKQGRKKSNINTKLKEVGMEKSGQQLLGQLSGGQLQRVLIAKSLLNNPKILFLDEPAAGIDLKGERSFYELIKHLNEEHGVTIILVSHEMDIVYNYATSVVCLNKQMLCFGKPKKVLTDQMLKQLYDENITLYQHKVDKHG